VRNIVAFDVEGGGGPGGFVCGAIHDDRGGRFYTDRESMFHDLLQYGRKTAYVFAHGLQYDLPLIEGDAFPMGELLFTRYGLLWSTYTVAGRKFRLYDSLNLFPRLSIEALGQMVVLPKLPLSEELKRQLAQGRPLAFFTPVEQELIRVYCTRDAEILYLALMSLQEIALSMGGQLRPTIAGCAMDVFRRQFMRWPWPVVGPATNKLARPAYYGGRCENFAYGVVPGVNAYDATSLYPYVQSKTKYPHPRYLEVEWQPRLSGSWTEWEGVAECTVAVPERFVPPLPHRSDRRLFFPTGKIHGTWTLVELRHALDVGCDLISVDWVLGSSVLFNPFQDFVEQLFALRMGYQVADDPRSSIVKLLLNSLYGRWGLSPEGSLYSLVNLDTDQLADLPEGAVTIVSPHGLYAYAPIPNLRQPDYVNTLFAAQIAAAARLHLLKELEAQDENMAYCDTDSLITRGSLGTSGGLGGWRLEVGRCTADLVAAKDYALWEGDRAIQFTVKGVPAEVAETYFKVGFARYRRALGVREAISHGRNPSEWVQVLKRRGAVLPKRCPLAPSFPASSEWVSSRPYSVKELASLTVGRGLPGDGEGYDPAPLLLPAPRAVQEELL
jgi:hypothetical protein